MSLNEQFARKIATLEQEIADLRALHAQMILSQAQWSGEERRRPALRVEPPRPEPAKVVAGPWKIGRCCAGGEACHGGFGCAGRDDAA